MTISELLTKGDPFQLQVLIWLPLTEDYWLEELLIVEQK